MNRFGFTRVTAISHVTSVANPRRNAAEMIRLLDGVVDCDVVLFPECAVTGYTCADLFGQSSLLAAAVDAVGEIAAASAGREQLIVVGVPLAVGDRLFNCAAAISDGQVIGVVPKQFIPTYNEFYERRWFAPATGDEPEEIELAGRDVPFGIDLLFTAGPAVVGIEICEDLWVPVAPSSYQALAGANILLNPSASNEVIGKSAYRRHLVRAQSARCLAAYVYASAGDGESTTDLVYDGDCLIAENGHLLAASPRLGTADWKYRQPVVITADVDVEALQHQRRAHGTHADGLALVPRHYRRVEFALRRDMTGLQREISGTPFVPAGREALDERCREIFAIQCAGLARRIEQLDAETPLTIGVSGGLDSTLALLVTTKTCDMQGLLRRRICGLTMPGFGTTSTTKTNAQRLMTHLGITSEVIDIRPLCLEAFRELGHRPFGVDCEGLSLDAAQEALVQAAAGGQGDLVFENVQARIRTFLLMSRGFVVGTGDMSEAALGWSTYNADHMSMYNPNCSIPKTLVQFLVRSAAMVEFEGAVRETLLSIAETPISPELLPPSASGEITQSTEATLGPYELHDFFLFHVVRHGASREKIRFLARHARFTNAFDDALVDRTLNTFYGRFFANQFKRSCVPDGPKVGTVSLSPRGDWRMPSDADPGLWIDE